MPALIDRWSGPVWFGLTLSGILIVAGIVALVNVHGHDGLAYWLVDSTDPYARSGPGLAGLGVFRYSPTIAALMDPLGALPWPVFTSAWLVAQLVALRFLGGRWWLALVMLPPVWLDLAAGNVNIFLAMAIVGGFRFPGAWALVALTKVMPFVGVLWFVGRRDWRGLAWAVGVTTALVLGSILLTGLDPWLHWARVLGSSAGETPAGFHVAIWTLPRVLAGAALAYYAGVTDRAWLVPIAVVLAMPTLWIIAFVPLLALLPLVAVTRPARPVETAGWRTPFRLERQAARDEAA